MIFCSLIIFVFGNIVMAAQDTNKKTQTKNYEFINGKWFDGKTFRKKIFYSINGFFSDKKPKRIDEIIDLKNGFVIPPFGDAHTHSFYTDEDLESKIEKNLAAGNFYVQVLANPQKSVVPVREKLKNSPLEVLFANGGLTSTLGHPFFAFEPTAMDIKGRYWESAEDLAKIRKSRLAENDGYWFFDSVKDVDEKWEKYLAGKPHVIKIFLLDAENQSKLGVEEKAGFKGLLPEVAGYIVKKAHENGLRVFAHIETANDLRLGIKIGVDAFAHLPGYNFEWNDTPESAKKYDPTKEDFEAIAKKKIIVIPTLSLSEQYSYKWKSDGTFELDKERNEKVLARQKKLVQMMIENKVLIALGSDESNGHGMKEIFYIYKNKILDPLKLLQIATETPQLMFPNRRIGKLKNGYESSFLVLEKNPIEDFETIKNIKMRFKQGKFLDIKEK